MDTHNPPLDADPHGQPFNLRFNRARRAERDLCEMLGLIKGILADGAVTTDEATLLRDWVQRRADIVDQWPINVLKQRLDNIFADGKIDDLERADLAELLKTVVGGSAGIIDGHDAATELPIDRPPPELIWEGSIFVFTGKFAFGPRAACERAVARLQGTCEDAITKRTNYLIVGTFGSRDWIHTSFGRKIEKAVGYREEGMPLAIVAEEYWASMLPQSRA